MDDSSLLHKMALMINGKIQWELLDSGFFRKLMVPVFVNCISRPPCLEYWRKSLLVWEEPSLKIETLQLMLQSSLFIC